jgi:1-acyl-sn-glycerol-3-phosphate acyltransferase
MIMLVFLRKILRLTVTWLWLPLMGIITIYYHIFGGGYWKKVLIISHCARKWGKGITNIMGIEIKVHGDVEQADGVLIVSNHCGYLDILVEAATFPIRFAPKNDIRKWPFLGWYLGLSMPIWVKRESKQQSVNVMEACRDTLLHGINTLIYPEGTSTDGEHGILPFKSTAFEAVCRQDIPILPVVIAYHPVPDGFKLCWIGNDRLLPHFWRVIGYRKIVAEIHILPKVYPQGENRKELAVRVHDLMEEKYNQIKSKITKQGELV